LPKTGTSALQNRLERHAPTLRKKHIFTFSRIELAHRLAIEAIVDPERRDGADMVGLLTHRWEKVEAQLTDAVRDDMIGKIVFSSEYFTHTEPPAVRQMLAALNLTDVSIVVALRRQDRFVESAYSQFVSMEGRTDPLDPPQYDERLDWHRLVSAWAEAFDGKIAILLYDKILSEGGSIVKEVIRSMDGELYDFALKNQDYDQKTNVSLPAKIVEFKRLVNRLKDVELDSFIDSAVQSGIDDTKFRLDSERASAYMNFYRRSNRALARNFLGFDDDLFDETDLSSRRPGADYTGRLPVDVLAALFALYIKKNGEHLAQISGVRKDSEARTLVEMVRERDLQLVEAGSSLERLLREASERDHRLVEADSTIRTLLRQAVERDERLVEADGTIRMLLLQVEDRNRQMVEADGTIRMLLRQAEDRDSRLVEADSAIRELLQQIKKRDRGLARRARDFLLGFLSKIRR